MYTEKEYETYCKVKHDLLLQDAKRYVLRHFKADKDEDSEYIRYVLSQIDLEQITDDFEIAYDDSYNAWETWDNLIGDYIWHMKHDDDDESEY